MKRKLREQLYTTSFGYSVYKFFKHQYYGFLAILTMLNHYKVKFKNKLVLGRNFSKKLHLGCGHVYLKGWINIDNYIGQKRKKDLWLDITNGLPFEDGSVTAIFSSHVLEHFAIEDVFRILRECYRVLNIGGHLRIAVPSLTIALDKYLHNNTDAFETEGKTVSRRFVNFILWYGDHRNMFDYDYLKEVLEEVGFKRVAEKEFMESSFFTDDEIKGIDKYKDTTLFRECYKID